MTLVWGTNSPAETESDPTGTRLVEQARDLARREPLALAFLAVDPAEMASDMDLLATVLASALPREQQARHALTLARDVLSTDHAAVSATLRDISVTTVKNFEPGGEIATLLFSRGIHAILAHRVAHSLWRSGRHELALGFKTVCGRVFSTDIHPGASFGRGVWLDHGVGFVVGETSVIEDDVAIWHGVTLGSTLKQTGEGRHPRLRRGCTVGAGCTILGGIEVGEGSVVAAGSVVLANVPPGTTVAGVPARPKARSTTSFAGFQA